MTATVIIPPQRVAVAGAARRQSLGMIALKGGINSKDLSFKGILSYNFSW